MRNFRQKDAGTEHAGRASRASQRWQFAFAMPNKALLQTSSYRPYPLKITSLFNTVSLLGLWDIFWCRCSRGNIHRHAERQNFPGKVRLLSSGVSVLQLLKTVLMSWHVLATPRLVSHNRLHKSKHDQQKKRNYAKLASDILWQVS